MRLVWLACLLVLFAACTRPNHTIIAVPGEGNLVRIDFEQIPVSARREPCFVVVERRPDFMSEPVRLGPAAGSLPYTVDGHHSAYTLVHRR